MPLYGNPRAGKNADGTLNDFTLLYLYTKSGEPVTDGDILFLRKSERDIWVTTLSVPGYDG